MNEAMLVGFGAPVLALLVALVGARLVYRANTSARDAP